MAASSYYSTVQKAYIAFYGRPADTNGLTYWSTRIDAAGGNISSIIQAFGTSAEATSLYGSLSNAAAVNTLYKQIFGRDADITGLNFYVGKLLDGSYTLVNIAQRIIDGATTGTDKDIVTNKLSAAQSFTDSINTADEVIGYSGDAAAQSARDWLANVTSTSASVTTAVGNIDSTLSTIASTGGQSGTSYSFTTAADILSGGVNNDTFTGAVGTLATGDTIDGNAGTDTVVGRLNASGTVAPTITDVEIIELDFRASGINFDLSDVGAFNKVTIDGTSTLSGATVTNLKDGETVVLTGDVQFTALNLGSDNDTASAALTIGLASTKSASIVLNAGGATATDFHTVTLNVTGATAHVLGSATDFRNVNKVIVTGSAALTFPKSALSSTGTAFAQMSALDASGKTQGGVTWKQDTAQATDLTLNFKGGAGNDSFNFVTAFNNLDVLDGGAGTDTVNLTLDGSENKSLSFSNIEKLVVNDSGDNTLNLASAGGASAIDIQFTAAGSLTLKGVKSALSVVNLNSAAAAGTATLDYTASTDVTVNLGYVNASASGLGVTYGNFGVSGSLGTVTINGASNTAANQLGNLWVNGATSVVIANNGSDLTVGSASLTAADVFALNVSGATADVSIGDIIATTAQTVTITNTNGSALTITGTANFNEAGAITIAVGADAASNVNIDIDTLTVDRSADDVTLTVNALGQGQITLSALTFGTANCANHDITVNLKAENASAIVSINDLTMPEQQSAGGGTVHLYGNGSINIASAAGWTALATANTLVIEGSSFSGKLSANFSAFDNKVNITLNNKTGHVISGGSAADTITLSGGSAQATIDGNGGDDQIYLDAATASVNVLKYNVDVASGTSTTAFDAFQTGAGSDTIYGFQKGDIIELTGRTYGADQAGSAIYGATLVGAALSAVYGAGDSAAAPSSFGGVAVYANGNGDTVVELLAGYSAGAISANGADTIVASSVIVITLNGVTLTQISSAATTYSSIAILQNEGSALQLTF